MNKFYRSTTPKQIFNVKLDVDLSKTKDIQITYVENDEIVLQKHKADLTINGSEVSFKMTTEETKKFKGNSRVTIQLMIVLPDGSVIASDILEIHCSKVLSEV